MIMALSILVGFLVFTNAATAIILTIFHQKEKEDLHNRLMAKSPDEYIYDKHIAPTEADILKEEFQPNKEKLTEDPELRQKREMAKQF